MRILYSFLSINNIFTIDYLLAPNYIVEYYIFNK